MNDYPTPWTPDIVERFDALLAERPVLTYRQIAARLSEVNGWYFTKNSCIGYAKRNGIPSRNPARPSRRGKTSKPRAKPHVPKLRVASRLTRQEPLKKIGKVLLENLQACDCRWPEGQRPPYLFCGLPQIDGSSYCVEHTRRATPSFGKRT